MQSTIKPKKSSTPLSNAIKALKSYIPVEDRAQAKKEEELNGSFNKLFFQTLPIAHQQLHPTNPVSLVEKKDINVAILKPKAENEQKVIINNKIAFAHLRKRHQAYLQSQSADKQRPFPFISSYLFNGENGKVSLAAEGGDLFTGIRSQAEHITPERLKEIIAQIFLSVNYLHSAGLVHRDIKPENFLVYKTHEGPRIVLADLDDITESGSNGAFYLVGTPGYLAPELLKIQYKGLRRESFLDVCKKGANPFTENRFVDKKAVDCYAVGWTLDDLLQQIPEKNLSALSKEDRGHLKRLYQGLTDKNPATRWTMEQAMKSEFFGANPQDYFDTILQKYEIPETYYGSDYYIPANDFFPEYNNEFFDFPEPIRNIIKRADRLNSQMQFFNSDFPVEQEHIDATLRTLNNQPSLLDEINGVLIYIEPQNNIYKLLTTLRTAITIAENRVQQAKKKLEDKKTQRENKIKTNNPLFKQLLINKCIKQNDITHYLMDETCQTNYQLSALLEKSKNKKQDFKAALLELNEYLYEMDERINKLALRIEHPDPEIINDKEMSLESHKILIDSRNELDIYRRAITQEAALVRTSHLPLLTESLHRMMFKSRWPNHPNNVVDLQDANKNGANTACSFQLSDKISSMKWGRVIGPLGKLIVGGFLISLAVTSIALLSVSTAGVFPAVLGLSYIIAISSVSGLAGGVGLGGLVMGAKDLYDTTKNRHQTIARNINTFFKLPFPQKRAPIMASSAPELKM